MADSRETLARIREQADAATDGPWEAGERCVFTLDGAPVVSDDVVHYVHGMAGEGVCHGADAEFIAAARTTVPALLDALEKVLELADRLENYAEELDADGEDGYADAARTDAHRIRTTVTTALEGLHHA